MASYLVFEGTPDLITWTLVGKQESDGPEAALREHFADAPVTKPRAAIAESRWHVRLEPLVMPNPAEIAGQEKLDLPEPELSRLPGPDA